MPEGLYVTIVKDSPAFIHNDKITKKGNSFLIILTLSILTLILTLLSFFFIYFFFFFGGNILGTSGLQFVIVDSVDEISFFYAIQ